LGLRYYGHEIDGGVLSYAKRMHAGHVFVSIRDGVARPGPFDLVVANCCFHHIPDAVRG
jgi:hypothetical protein